MDDRFSLYDFFTLLIPGFALVGLAYLLAAVFLHSLWPPQGLGDLVAAAVGTLLAYLAGHLVEKLGRHLDTARRWARRGEPTGRLLTSEQVLLGGDKAFTPEFKDRLLAKVEARFGVPLPATDPVTWTTEQRRQVFWLCYADVTQNGSAERAQTFLALWGFHRNMAVVCRMGRVVGAAVAAMAGTLFALHHLDLVSPALPTLPAWFLPTHGSLAATGLLVLGVSWALLDEFQQNQSSQDRGFVTEVYRAFYVRGEEEPPAAPAVPRIGRATVPLPDVPTP
ncbi:MAG TPA: hypothetical protein VM241_02840 [Candidatus Thermoplasmatota archaeon]|nr:hypothetical protein [Candidatus Thermoplasmatota archaeon]